MAPREKNFKYIFKIYQDHSK